MQTIQLGQSDLRVTPICLGTMTFGEQVAEADAHAIMDRAIEDRMRIAFVHLFAEGHGAQADGCYAQVALAELDGLHGVTEISVRSVGRAY